MKSRELGIHRQVYRKEKLHYLYGCSADTLRLPEDDLQS